MKKLLVILLFLFPFHGAWANDYEFFGIKIGDKIQKYKSDYKTRIIYPSKLYERVKYNDTIKLSTNEVPEKNKHFQEYYLEITPETSLIYEIRAKGRLDKNESYKKNYVCEQIVDEISNAISNKYSIQPVVKGKKNKELKFSSPPYKKIFRFGYKEGILSDNAFTIMIFCHVSNKGREFYYDIIDFSFTEWEINNVKWEELDKIQKEFDEKSIKELKNNIDTRGFE